MATPTEPLDWVPVSRGSIASKPSSERDDEIFGRIKVDALVTLILQAEQARQEQSLLLTAINAAVTADTPATSASAHSDAPFSRDCMHGIVTGYGERDKRGDEAKLQANQESVPYVLLDVRLADEYRRGRIIAATSYPHTNLSRGVELPAMRALRNRPGKLIILYDDAERHSTRVAATLVQRGYDNVVVLTGGMTMASIKYPNGLIVGSFDIVDPSNRIVTQSITSENLAQKTFTDENLVTLRAQLEHNLLPRFARVGLTKDTNASKIRRKESLDSKKNKSGDKKPKWR